MSRLKSIGLGGPLKRGRNNRTTPGDALRPSCKGCASIGLKASEYSGLNHRHLAVSACGDEAGEKPSEQATREEAEAVRRRHKFARKQAIRDGLIAASQKKRMNRSTAPAVAASTVLPIHARRPT
jgi:hypothetical protein